MRRRHECRVVIDIEEREAGLLKVVKWKRWRSSGMMEVMHGKKWES